MKVKTILVQSASHEAGFRLIENAARLASVAEGHLVALVVCPEPPVPYASMMDVPSASFADDLENARAALAAEVEAVTRALEPLGVSFETRSRCCPAGLLGAEFSKHARYADIAVFPLRKDEEHWYQLLDTTLFESGRPVLLTPDGANLEHIGHRVLLAWDASREAARAVHDALPLIDANAEVRVVTVDPHVSSDRHGELPGADLATMLARHGVKVTVDAIPSADRTMAKTLLTHARDVDADLIVTGAYGHSRIGQMLIGGVTRELMETADRPILMSH